MPIVELAQILLRRGPQAQLPGAPVSTSPLVFSPGLEPAQLSLCDDIGRLFVGHLPSSGNANFQRVEFPYQNIEVLTENSTTAFRRMTDNVTRVNETGYLVSEPVPADAVWRPVLMPVPPGVTGIGPQPFRLSFNGAAHEVGASIDYVVMTDGLPVKTGRLTIMSDGSGNPPLIAEEAVQQRRAGVSTFSDPADMYDIMRFRTGILGTAPASYLYLEARNLLSTPATVYFRVDRARP